MSLEVGLKLKVILRARYLYLQGHRNRKRVGKKDHSLLLPVATL